MTGSLKEIGYAKDMPLAVDKTSIRHLIAENEELFGFRQGKHNFGLSYVYQAHAFASYDWGTRRFISPPGNTRVVMSHETVHYLMHRRGRLLDPKDNTLYGGLLDEIVALLAPMEIYEYNGRFRLESYTDDDAMRDHSERDKSVLDSVLGGLALAKQHRAIEMKLPPGAPERVVDPIMLDLATFTQYAGTLPVEHRRQAGSLIAFDIADRLLEAGMTSGEFFGIMDEAVREGIPPIDLYFQMIGIAKEQNPGFFPA